MSNRPFRHLCPEADLRDAMTENEFWEHVGKKLGYNTDPYQDDGPDPDEVATDEPCAECGSPGACAYDAEGRPLIHSTMEVDNE